MSATMPMVGAWTVVEPPECCKPPKEVVAAFTEATHLIGAKYELAAYLGKQLVSGMNYAFAAVQTIVGQEPHSILLTVHAPLEGKATILHIRPLLETAAL